jgi:hypothetical protein
MFAAIHMGSIIWDHRNRRQWDDGRHSDNLTPRAYRSASSPLATSMAISELTFRSYGILGRNGSRIEIKLCVEHIFAPAYFSRNAQRSISGQWNKLAERSGIEHESIVMSWISHKWVIALKKKPVPP